MSDFLEDQKNFWNAIHIVGGNILSKYPGSKVYLTMQGNTGSIMVDTAVEGTTSNEYLYGMNGNDVIIGNGGTQDNLYGYTQNNGIDMTNTQHVRNDENLMTIIQNSWRVA
jgi:hypothetical protein